MRRVLAVLISLAPLASFAAPPTDLRAARQRMVDDLAGLRFDRLGDPVLRWDHIPPVRTPRAAPHELLVVLVEFPDKHFVRFAGEPDQGERLAAYYQDLLFDPTYSKPNTLSHYYWTQSLHTYHLQGHVLPPIRLSKPRAAYGAPSRPEGGDWRNDTATEGMVEEALAAAVKAHGGQIDWSSLDRWDPLDFDGDDLREEADGYLDHLVLVFAGGGQSSCQGLWKLGDVLNPNAGPEAYEALTGGARECADRLWPHRFMVQKREGRGPTVEGRVNARGGVPLRPGLWSRDYNMQSEYTEPSTFIHEFGHSLGLPDVYARTSSNSTGPWEVMSATRDPVAQNLSAWSRLMLGWLRPRVFVPPEFGGKAVQSMYLQILDAPPTEDRAARAESERRGLYRAALVVLPPKVREVKLGALPKKGGRRALYSGQGNELHREARLRLDLKAAKKRVTLSFDAWWDIEGGWDFAYLEVSADEGRTWIRRLPTDRRHMPAKHGHDGKQTLPGFTGLSGDLDGDGKNESRRGCDPKRKLAHGEDKAGAAKNPCLEATWVRVAFDLSDLGGQRVWVRWRYFTDMAAVQPGLLIDNVRVTGLAEPLREDFEGRPGDRWRLGEFTLSAGHHTLLVPHYYLFEYRDPYQPDFSYDHAIADVGLGFFFNEATGRMGAMQVRPKAGVVAWYYDGAFAWSENDPAINGSGRGVLLALDSHPAELSIPGVDDLLSGEGIYARGYSVKAPEAQRRLEADARRTICFVRSGAYRPRDVPVECPTEAAPMGSLTLDGKTLMYSYEVINSLLPGAPRAKYMKAGELLDYKRRKGEVSWRLRDRSLRYLQTLDAPFSLEATPDGVRVYDVDPQRGLVVTERRSHAAVSQFSDATPARWLNPKLYFGGVAVPREGLGFQLARPKQGAPAGATVKLWITWER